MGDLGPFALDTIVCGECSRLMAELLPNGCIDLTVTSPPYDNIRDYEGYVFDFEPIAAQLWRVTKLGGVVVWVVGDATVNGSETGTSFRQALHFMETGFNLHDTMIYEKAGFRFPDERRYNPVFEYMFVFSKGSPETFNPIEDKRNVYVGAKVARRSQTRNRDGSLTANSAWRHNKDKRVKRYGKRNNIWRIYQKKVGKDVSAHPAIFPEALARDHILSWSNPGDIVLDPMCGSGTTLKMAIELGRHYLGFDSCKKYVELARRRIQGARIPLLEATP